MPHKDPAKRKAYMREYYRRWRQKNLERIRVREHDYYIRNRTKYILRNQKWTKEHPVETRVHVRRYWAKLKRRVIERLGGKCAWCGFEDLRALQVDHIYGGGHKDRKSRYLFTLYQDILGNREIGVQCLCANCNWIKKAERKEVKAPPATRKCASKKQEWYDLRMRVFAVLGGKCIHCGFLDKRAFQVDHINGNGHAEIKRGYWTMLRRIARGNSDGYQLLCANCNWIKRVERQEIVHGVDPRCR